MIGGAVAVLFQGQDLVFCGLLCIWIIKGSLEGFNKGSLSGKGEFPCAWIYVGLEPGPRGSGEARRSIGDFTGFRWILVWVRVEY